MKRIIGFCFFLAVFCAGALGATDPSDGLSIDYRDQIEQLARRCDADRMTLEAQVTRRRLFETTPYEISVPLLPETIRGELPGDASQAQRRWYADLKTIQNREARRLFDQAKEAAAQSRGYEAFATAALALWIDPDNADLRKIFGQTLEQNHWRTAWERGNLAEGKIDHPVFGWIPADQVKRYEARERFFRNRWMPVEEEARQREKMNRPWTVETEHFRIETAVSLEEGVRLGRLLEEFQRLWEFYFVRVTRTESEAARQILGRSAPAQKRHEVRVFRNRRDYLTAATKIDPTATVSSGGYLPSVGAIFIYVPEHPDDTPLETMLCHEATHQLFAESRLVRKNGSRPRVLTAGLSANYAVLEGIAVYLETFRVQGDRASAGGLASFRFVRAKERADEPDGLLPLERFVSLGKEAFQSGSNLPALYTEAAGATHFFLHADGGKYRAAFFELLVRVYANRDEADDLSRLTEEPFERLDTLFHNYLRETPFAE